MSIIKYNNQDNKCATVTDVKNETNVMNVTNVTNVSLKFPLTILHTLLISKSFGALRGSSLPKSPFFQLLWILPFFQRREKKKKERWRRPTGRLMRTGRVGGAPSASAENWQGRQRTGRTGRVGSAPARSPRHQQGHQGTGKTGRAETSEVAL